MKSHIEPLDSSTFWSATKKVLLTIFIFSLILISVICYVIYSLVKDSFDYSKYDANTIEEKIKTPWVIKEDINTLNIKQSKVVIYWYDGTNVQISCQGNTQKKVDNSLILEYSDCFIKLPKNSFNINSYQSKLVLIKPNESLKFESKQSSISILNSKDKKIELEGEFYQSKISNYSY